MLSCLQSFHHSSISSWLRARNEKLASIENRPFFCPTSPPIAFLPSMWNLCDRALAFVGAPSVHSGRKSDSSGFGCLVRSDDACSCR